MKPIVNRHARSSYEFLNHYEAGLVLAGAEVKAVKKGSISLSSAYVTHENGELWLKNMHISPYQRANQPGYDPERPRKILMRRKEIDTIMGKLKQEGLTMIPEKVYSKSGLIKVELVVARGLKKHDKRERIKKRDVSRSIARALKRR